MLQLFTSLACANECDIRDGVESKPPSYGIVKLGGEPECTEPLMNLDEVTGWILKRFSKYKNQSWALNVSPHVYVRYTNYIDAIQYCYHNGGIVISIMPSSLREDIKDSLTTFRDRVKYRYGKDI